jgi:hypothetical protein
MSDSVNTTFKNIPTGNRPDTRRRAGKDQISGL